MARRRSRTKALARGAAKAVARELGSIGKEVLKGLAEIATLGLYTASRPRRKRR